MNSALGYILLYRSIMSNWVWQDPEYFRAFSWLLMTANFEDREAMMSGHLVNVHRGELLTSLNTICRETGLSMKRARNFLKKLEKGHMIRQEKGSKWTKIIICNYDSYQPKGQAKGGKRAESGANRGQTEGNTIINYNEFLKVFNEITSRSFQGTKKDKSQFNARIKEGRTLLDFETAIKNCLSNPFHIENPQHLTPEFITRADKLEKYLNYTKPSQQQLPLHRNSGNAKPPEPSITPDYDPNKVYLTSNSA